MTTACLTIQAIGQMVTMVSQLDTSIALKQAYVAQLASIYQNTVN